MLSVQSKDTMSVPRDVCTYGCLYALKGSYLYIVLSVHSAVCTQSKEAMSVHNVVCTQSKEAMSVHNVVCTV